jgi:type II secretory pathway component PulF
MAVFAYKGVAGDSASSGTIVADTPWQARQALRDRGVRPLQVVEMRSATGPSGAGSARPLFSRPGRRGAELISAIRELSTLLAVGVPLTEALDTVAEQHHGAFAAGLVQVRDRVSSGSSMAEAMRQRPDLFDDITIAVVEVGENSGRLEETLETLADFKQRWSELGNHVVTALIYPVMVLIMAVGVSIFMMTFVVPSILTGLADQGRELPWVTRAVKFVSDLMVDHGWWALPGAIGVGALVGLVLNRPGAKLWWHGLSLRLPLIGQIIAKQAVVRIATVVSTLMKSGVAFERAVEIARSVTGNRVIGAALEQCAAAVRSGSDIAQALAGTRAFSRTVVQVFAVGQESGRLEEMLDRLARDHDRQVYTLARRLTTFLEPVMIILLAVIVGFIAFATLLPILEAGNVL